MNTKLASSLALAVIALGSAAGVHRNNLQSRRDAALPLTMDAYVWQRRWTPEVREAIDRAGSLLNEICVEAAEITVKHGKLDAQRANIDWGTLASSQCRVGITWRIGAEALAKGWDANRREDLQRIVFDSLREAREHHVHIVEAQLDFDCPERLLRDYADFLRGLRAESSETRWTFTALPSWLKDAAFKSLARSSDGFVLQVHWLRPKPSGNGEPTLMIIDEARDAVARASRYGVPFRVALPTYGSAVICDLNGNWLDVVSEERRSPLGYASVREAMASPEDCLQLIAEWRDARPSHLRGIVWYRLPVASDRRNWSWEQFRAVIEGRHPVPKFEIGLEHNSEGWEDVVVRNVGNGDGSTPRKIVIESPRIASADGLAIYRMEEDGTTVSFITARPPRLCAGASLSIGWLRRSALGQREDIQIEP